MTNQPLKLRQSIKAQWPALLILVGLGFLAVLSGPAASVLEGGFAEQGVTVPDLSAGVMYVAGGLAIVVLATMVLYPMLANRYTLTADQVQEVNGIIERHTRTTRLEHVRSVNVEISFIGRLLGYGDVVFFTAGSGGDDVRLTGIDDPETIARRAEHFTRQAVPTGKLPGDIGGAGASTPEAVQLMRKAQLQREEIKKILEGMQSQHQQSIETLSDLITTLTLRVEGLGGVSETDQWKPKRHVAGEAAARQNTKPVPKNDQARTIPERTENQETSSVQTTTDEWDNKKFFGDDAEKPLVADPQERSTAKPKQPLANHKPNQRSQRTTRGNIPFSPPPDDGEHEHILDRPRPEQQELSESERAKRRALVEKALSEQDTVHPPSDSDTDGAPPVLKEVSLLKPNRPKPDDSAE